MYKLSLHIKPFNSKKNKAAIVMIYYKDGEAGGFMRSLKARGISLTFLATRGCTEEEYITESNPWRYTFLNYNDWDSLIRDERKYAEDPAWFKELEQLRKQFPAFKKKPTQWLPVILPKPGGQLQLLFPEP